MTLNLSRRIHACIPGSTTAALAAGIGIDIGIATASSSISPTATVFTAAFWAITRAMKSSASSPIQACPQGAWSRCAAGSASSTRSHAVRHLVPRPQTSDSFCSLSRSHVARYCLPDHGKPLDPAHSFCAQCLRRTLWHSQRLVCPSPRRIALVEFDRAPRGEAIRN